MAAATQRGYDPVAMACTQVDVQQAATTENGLSNIKDEGLFQLVNLRRKDTQRKMASKGGVPAAPLMSKPAAGNPSGLVCNGSARAAQPRSKTATLEIWVRPSPSTVGDEAGTTLNVWPVWTQNLIVSGTQHVEAANKLARDFNLNVGSGSIPLRGHVKLNGEVCRGVITVRADETTTSLKGKVVWREGDLAFVRKLGTSNVAVLTFVGRRVPRYVHYNCECAVVREYKRTVPACYQRGTIGHRIDNCPHPDLTRCGYCGQRVGASEQGLAEHECTPSCMVCGEAHHTGSETENSSDFNVHEPSNKGPPATRRASLPTTEENKNRKTSGQSVKPPAFQEGDFPPLGKSKAAITFKVSNWAEIASTPSSSSSPLELELKKEIASLRTQNEQLEQKVIALQNVRAEPHFPGSLDSGDESVSLCSGMGPVTYGPLNSNLESRMAALEKSVTDQMAPLPTMIAQTMQAQMQRLVTTLTQQITAAVTQNIKSWIQASPKLFRRAGPVKELGCPSKVCRNIELLLLLDEDSSTDSSTSSSSDSGSDDDDDLALCEFMFEQLFAPPEKRPKVGVVCGKTVAAYSDEEFRRNFRLSRAVANSLAAEFAKSPRYPSRTDRGGLDPKSPEEHVLSFLWCPAGKVRSVYVNRHHYPSLTLQGICDNRKRFLDASTGAPSKVNDSRIFRLSTISKKLPQLCAGKYHILGDAAYPSREFLMTPIRDYGSLYASDKAFSTKLSSTRVLIENAFGELKGRFRQLQRLDLTTVDNMTKFILACCVLHNICIDNGDLPDSLVQDTRLSAQANNDQNPTAAAVGSGTSREESLLRALQKLNEKNLSPRWG
ncbi:hypothetical protein HPB49_024102 [Dermacentor silvarum]|uniref:Uncharacterized protein n=1 Tax=Dermacentor silvarum TaxID=543639 RepID=A0ACB8DLJ5_DERSI|nr:hypothetical protein HPB49_024102 [Dermacentor silvarum]